MASSVYPDQDGTVTASDAANFIPAIWSDEIIAAYQKNLVLAPLVRKMSMVGKKGDTMYIPKPVRGAATAKAASTAVTIQEHSDTQLAIVVDQHFEYSRMIEDFADVQSQTSLRRFYTEDAGYAMSKVVDDNLFNRGTEFGTGGYVAAPAPADWVSDATFYNDGGSGPAVAWAENAVLAADILTDAFIRNMIQKMDDNDVPMSDRFLIIPPSARNALMGIDRYVSSDFGGGQTVVNGKLGNVYGMDVYVSSNCPIIETASENGAGTAVVRGAMMAHKDTIVLAEQKGIRSQVQYKQEFLGTLLTSDRIYGTKVARPESGFILALADQSNKAVTMGSFSCMTEAPLFVFNRSYYEYIQRRWWVRGF